MLSFSCPSCQKKLGVSEEHAGKKIKCPGCGNITVSPSVQIAEAPPPPPSPPQQAESIAQNDATTADMGLADFRLGQEKISTNKGKESSARLTEFLTPPQLADELGRLGKYRILSIIGHGGMGVVFKAEDSVLGRKVAIKAILPSLGASAQVRKRFQREAKSMAAVEHDHIVRLYEVNEDRGVSYIAMEFLSGQSLSNRLAENVPLSLEQILQIGREIAEGLAAAHARGLIHRDIKPANIWLEKRDTSTSPTAAFRVKILDFGLARADQDDSRITQSGAVVGTPAYMSPEQGRGEEVDFRCDLFSLGVVLYRISTGREPFAAKDALSTMMAIATERPNPPQVENFDLPVELSDLIMKLLEKDPEMRHSSAQEVADELLHIEAQLHGEAVTAKPPKTRAKPAASVAESKAAPKPKSNRATILLLVIGAILFFSCCVVVPAIYAFLLWIKPE